MSIEFYPDSKGQYVAIKDGYNQPPATIIVAAVEKVKLWSLLKPWQENYSFNVQGVTININTDRIPSPIVVYYNYWLDASEGIIPPVIGTVYLEKLPEVEIERRRTKRTGINQMLQGGFLQALDATTILENTQKIAQLEGRPVPWKPKAWPEVEAMKNSF